MQKVVCGSSIRDDTETELQRYNEAMQVKRIVQDSGDVAKARRLLGNIRAFFYIGAALFLALLVYFWNR